MRKGRTAVLLCAALLCALLLSGCERLLPIRAPASSGQGQQAVPPTETKRLYSLCMGETWDAWADYIILDEDGRAVLQGQGLALLYDGETGLPQCIVARREEEGRRRSVLGGKSYVSYTAVYDTEGNLLEDWQQVSYTDGLGPYVLRQEDGENVLGDERRGGCLYNLYTKERRYEGIRYLRDLEDGRWSALDGNGELMGILNGEGEVVMGFPMEERFGFVTAWNGRYVTSLQNDVVVDKDFNVLYTAQKGVRVEPMGAGLLERVWQGYDMRDKRILNSRFEEVYAVQEGAYLSYYDGSILILGQSNGEYTLCDGRGRPMVEGCAWITPGCAYNRYDAQQFVVYKDGVAYVLDSDGNELARKEGSFWGCMYVAPGRYILYVEDYGPSASDYSFADCVVDEKLEPLSEAYRYINNSWSPYRGEEESGCLEAVLLSGGAGNTKMDVLDMEGRILLADVTQLQEYGPDRYVVVWGFDCGLVDGRGNWLYKTSIFGALEDE